jgi:hypothetical protein
LTAGQKRGTEGLGGRLEAREDLKQTKPENSKWSGKKSDTGIREETFLPTEE